SEVAPVPAERERARREFHVRRRAERRRHDDHERQQEKAEHEAGDRPQRDATHTAPPHTRSSRNARWKITNSTVTTERSISASAAPRPQFSRSLIMRSISIATVICFGPPSSAGVTKNPIDDRNTSAQPAPIPGR